MRPKIDWRYCPLHLVNDGARLGIPPHFLDLCARIEHIDETLQFKQRLRQLARPIQSSWERLKSRLREAITRGADFKKFPSAGTDVYSVRVNDNYRAHLKHLRTGNEWTAFAIGTHKEMGHG